MGVRMHEVLARTGLARKALLYYEQQGLVRPRVDVNNDYRDYSQNDVARLLRIAILRQIGLPVGETGAALDSPACWRAGLRRHRERLLASREALERSLSALDAVLAEPDADVSPPGSRLQTIIRRSKNPIVHRRATSLLEHMLGADVDYLADYYAMPVDYLRRLIDAFEREGIDAVHEGTRTKAHSISPEECSLVVEMGRLSPRAIGIDRATWLLTQLRDLAVEQNSLRVVDLNGIRSALTDAKLPYQDDLL